MSLREADSKKPRNTMKDALTQLDMRENTASSRRHASRRVVNRSILQSDSLFGTEQQDDNAQELGPPINETFELSLTGPDQGTTGEGDTKTPWLVGAGKRSVVERPLTCEEAAAFVRVHPRTVKRMARAGKVPGHFRFGRIIGNWPASYPTGHLRIT
jgi:hypothetical protein